MLRRVGLRVYQLLVSVLLLLLVLAALGSIAARLIIANIDSFRGDIEQSLSDMGISGFAVERVVGHLNGIEPVLRLTGASLSVPGRSQALHVDELELSVDVPATLKRQELVIRAFRASVSKLILVKDTQGHWWLNDMRIFGGQESAGAVDFFAMFSRLPRYVSVNLDLVQLRDELAGTDYLIQHSRLKTQSFNERLAVQFATRLPDSLGGPLEVRFTGDQTSQTVYLSSSNLNAAGWLDVAGLRPEFLDQTRADVQLWAQFEGFDLQSATAQLDKAQVQLKKGDVVLAPLRFETVQQLQRQAQGWRWDANVSRLSYRGRPLSDLALSTRFGAEAEHAELAVSDVRLTEYLPVLHDLFAREWLGNYLSAASPDGEISSVVARLNLADWKDSGLAARFNGLTVSAFEDLPGIDNLDGDLLVSDRKLLLDLPEQPLTLNFARLFRDPLVIDAFSASVNAEFLDQQAVLSLPSLTLRNADVSAQARAWLELPYSDTPFMSLRVAYENGDATATGRYLPVAIMPKATVKWLDHSIKSGRIPQGGLLFHGRLKSLQALDREQSGIFHALFDLDKPQVDFLDGWPAAEQGHGTASFYNTSMQLDFQDVNFAAAKADSVSVGIADFFNPLLRIHADINQDAPAVLDSLAALPIIDAFKTVKANTKTVAGQISGTLDIDVPLDHESDDNGLVVAARAALQDVRLHIPGWAVDFSHANGDVSIDNANVEAKNITASYAGDAVTLQVKTHSAAESTDFLMQGQLHSQNLFKLAPNYVAQSISGQSPWSVKASVNNKPAANQPRVVIQAESELAGSRIDAPAPLFVDSDERVAYRFDGRLGYDLDFVFSASLGDVVNAQGRLLPASKDTMKLDYLDLNFSADSDRLNDNGVNLTGHIAALNIDDWNAFVRRYADGSGSAAAVMHQVKTLDLSVDELRWRGRSANAVKIHSVNRGDRHSGQIDSSVARGSFDVPFDSAPGRPISAKLDYLRLQKSEEKSATDSSTEPTLQDMPNLVVSSDELTLGDMQFSDFALQTVTEPERFVIKQLDLKRDQLALKSSGYWQYTPGIDSHLSVFNLKVQGKQFGDVVKKLGLGNSIRDGEVNFEGQIGWGSGLFDMNWETLIGEVSLSLKDGYLNNVEPGAGRFVGLLSLNALPKRLFLDFGDVLSEGMQFDEISGNFSISGEVMTTENATMEGASARVDLSGDTNLRRKTYDQHMVITPKVGETLPVLGSLAAGNAVGWGLLLIQKIFKKPIEKSVQVEYDITGSWDDPKLTRIEEPDPEPQPFDSDSGVLNDF